MTLRRPWLPIVPLVAIMAAHQLPLSEAAHWATIVALVALSGFAALWVRRAR